MKRIFIILFILLTITGIVSFASAQSTTTPDVGTPDPAKMGRDTAQQRLADVTVTTFEDAGLWKASIPSDDGVIELRIRTGEATAKLEMDKTRIDEETKVGTPVGQYVLGTKVRFYKRALTNFGIFPVRPLPIPGKTKTLSLWVIGRNFNHVIKIIVEDYFGNNHELSFGKLNFLGWKKLTVAVPPSIPQSDYHYTTKMGIKFVGLRVQCDLMESFGSFYLYFDDLSAVTDLFDEENRDKDDVYDDW